MRMRLVVVVGVHGSSVSHVNIPVEILGSSTRMAVLPGDGSGGGSVRAAAVMMAVALLGRSGSRSQGSRASGACAAAALSAPEKPQAALALERKARAGVDVVHNCLCHAWTTDLVGRGKGVVGSEPGVSLANLLALTAAIMRRHHQA